MDDAGVGVGVVLQDMQASLPESSHRNYSGHLATVVELSKETKKPLILISPNGGIMSERLLACIKDVEVPPIRGLRAGLGAIHHVTRKGLKGIRVWQGRYLGAAQPF